MRTKTRILLASSIAVLAAGGYFAYSVFATQGAGTLAQAPLNIEANIKPAFIMAVDDSNSMTFERLFAGGDGRMKWNNATGSFFSSAGVFYNVGDPCTGSESDCYLYLYPHNGYRDSYSPGDAIPPLDSLGFARSPTYNKTYFDPNVVYEPWLNADGSSWPDATPTAVRADPRNPTTYGTSGSSTSTKAYNVIYDLTTNRASNAEGFQVLSGMTIPDLSSRGMSYKTSANGNWSTAARTINSNATYYFDYYPATFYLPANDPAPAGYRTGNAYRPIVSDACGPGCDMRRYEIKPANYLTTADYNAAMQNFANWFQYARDRVLATVGSMTHALATVSNMRVGYFTINNLTNATMDDMGTASQKAALYSQIMSLYTRGGTPNRTAVNYLGQQFTRTDSGAPVQLACQRNSGMLFTDGYTNSGNVATVGNVDGSLASPFADSYADTLADIAAKYYSGSAVPLRTGSSFPTGKVRIPDECATLDPASAAYKRLDCQANLHMNFYGITLGAAGRIYGVNSAATADPYANAPNWNSLGNPTSVDDGTVIDEMWHATINSRGDFINASTPTEVTNAMRRVIDAAGRGATPSGGIGLTGARIGAGSLTVVPFYTSTNNGTDWYSKLTAQSVTPDAATGGATFATLWEASAQLPAAGSRTILRGKTTGGVVPSVASFTGSSVTAADLCADSLATCTAGGATNGITGTGSKLNISMTQAVDYLRGDQTLESSTLRRRTTRLGDIVNSTPVISSPFIDYGYRAIRTYSGTTATYPYQASYTTFLASKSSANLSMVYAGANDGMLHAFNGASGVESFAYVPATTLGHMGNLLFPYDAARQGDQLARHKYYVDGPTTVADAYINGAWKTVLVGTTGAGGRGVFALNVTTPGSFGASDVLWELNDRVTAPSNVNTNIGYVLGRPVIVPVMDAGGIRWKAIFGNGYNSTNQQAVLFVVDLETGTPTMITAQESGRSGIANGLGNIAVVDRWVGRTKGAGETAGRDGLADTVYAADQNGAIWKFDLRDNSVPNAPFFIATDPSSVRQPILGGIEVGAGPSGGVMVYFGTGSFSFETDKTDNQIQSFYGVNDRGSNVARTSLVRQTISDSAGNRTLSANGGNVYGWYVDLGSLSGTTLTASGERVVGYPRVENGLVFFTTYTPTSTVDCAGDGTNRLYGVAAVSGASSMNSIRFGGLNGDTVSASANGFVLNTGGSAPVRDIAVLSTPRTPPLPPPPPGTPPPPPPPGGRCSMIVEVAGAPPMYLPRACGRQSWRQVR